MKKIVIIFLAACALLSFSCNKYCDCKLFVDDVQDKEFKGRFVNETGKCADYNALNVIDGVTHETKCK